MTEEKKKSHYYGGKEKRALEVKKGAEETMMPYSFGEIHRDFDKMIDRFEREFEDFWDIPFRWRHGMRRHGFPMMPFREPTMPSVDIEDQGKDYRLTVDLPGFSKEEVEVEVSEDSVAVHAQKSQAKEESDKKFVRRERSAQTYFRRIPLPEKVRSDDAKANLSNGTLEIVLPKIQPRASRKLTISEGQPGAGEPKHMQGHSTVVRKQKDGRFMCPECGKTFEKKETAETHLHNEHLEHLRTVHHETHGRDTDKKHQT
ncbi:MAG: Hsp20/alpha crystallin family protein [Betaproteobacteria bacterium]